MMVDTTTGEGWRTLFITVGAVGIFWAVLWLINTSGERAKIIDSPPEPDPNSRAVASSRFVDVFAMKLFWICLITGVCVNLCWHFYNQWFPRYLTEEIQLSGRKEQWILAGFYVCADLGSMASGWMTRKLARSGYTVETARKRVMFGLGVAVLLLSAPAGFLPNDMLAVKFALFYLVAASAMGGFAIFFSLAQDIVPIHTAKILGVCGCISWLVISAAAMVAGGFAGPGRYAYLFLAVGMVPFIAGVIGHWWPEPPSEDEIREELSPA